jgi:DNA-binding response OmpR family regulator
VSTQAATILLIEDHRTTRRFLADNLAADGYEILEAECAEDAERMIASEFPDVAILDLGLPDRDGLELLREVRESDRIAGRFDPDLPILVLSGRAGELSKKEFALLRALSGDPTRVFTREELLRGVWGFRSMGMTRTLDSHASRLRKKLARDGDKFIVNVWGVGYRLLDGTIT